MYTAGGSINSTVTLSLPELEAHAQPVDWVDVSMCIAVMQLVFGAAQPVFGMVASKRSNRFVLILGVLLMGISMAGMIWSSSFAGLIFSLGILFGLGAGALAFGLVLASAIHFVGREYAMVISGMLNAAAGMIGFLLPPVLQSLLQEKGLVFTLTIMIGIAAALIPVAVAITSRDRAAWSVKISASVRLQL